MGVCLLKSVRFGVYIRLKISKMCLVVIFITSESCC